LLHGLGSDENDLFALRPRLNDWLFVISARAPLSYRFGGYMWFDLERDGPGLGTASIEPNLDLLARFVGEVVREYPIDPARLYVGGFSMGGAMAGAMLLLHPDALAGAIVASGFLLLDPTGRYRNAEAAGLPVFQAHGLYDPVVPIEYGRQTRDYWQSTPVELTYHEYPMGHEVSEAELRDLALWLDDLLISPYAEERK
jgi:phospholipase/carboxylesterase